MQQLSDESMMAQVKAGELDALGILYERYKGSLITYFLRLTGDRAASNDLLMNTFERVYKYRMSYKEEASFKSWLFQIGNNLTKDHFKNQRKQAKRSFHDPGQELSIVEDTIESRFTAKEVYQALDELSTLDKRIITQYYLLDLPYSEIAAMEDITVNTARIRVCRALKQLKQFLKQKENENG